MESVALEVPPNLSGHICTTTESVALEVPPNLSGTVLVSEWGFVYTAEQAMTAGRQWMLVMCMLPLVIGVGALLSGCCRLCMYSHGECTSPFNSTRERRRGASDLSAYQDGQTLKEAVSKLMQRVNQGFSVNSYEYYHVLKWCFQEKDLELVKQVHDSIKDSRMEQHGYVASMLLKCYIEFGRLPSAHELFNKLLNKYTITWNLMIGGYAKHDQAESAIEVYKQMRSEGGQPSAITFLSVLKACASSTAFKLGKDIHAHIINHGFQADLRVGNALVQMYFKTGLTGDARKVFQEMRIRNVISWNVMIGGLAEHGLGHEAFSLFLQMQREGITPDAITYLSILNPCSSTGAVEWLKEVHAHALEAGLEVDVRVGTALVQMYAKSGLIVDARKVFDKMRTRNVISWIVMIGGLAQHGHGREALQLFHEMKTEGVKPNDGVFVAVLSACSHAGLVEEGRSHFASMMRDYGMEPDLEHYNCVVDMLGRAGRLKEAQLFILNMPIKPNRVTWMTFLGACRIHKNVELAELAATECMKLKPTHAPAYVALSNVYASVGNWDEVSSIRTMMQERGIRKNPGRCSIEVGNKVHDFLVGDISHPETKEIYTMLSSLSEKLKAEGYTPDTRLVLRKTAERKKQSAICSHSEKLAIAYGLMHVPAGKPIRVYKNLRICTDCHVASKLISKITGREIVARDANRFHHFKGGSCSCGDYW